MSTRKVNIALVFVTAFATAAAAYVSYLQYQLTSSDLEGDRYEKEEESKIYLTLEPVIKVNSPSFRPLSSDFGLIRVELAFEYDYRVHAKGAVDGLTLRYEALSKVVEGRWRKFIDRHWSKIAMNNAENPFEPDVVFKDKIPVLIKSYYIWKGKEYIHSKMYILEVDVKWKNTKSFSFEARHLLPCSGGTLDEPDDVFNGKAAFVDVVGPASGGSIAGKAAGGPEYVLLINCG